MAEASLARGYRYIGITDHSKTAHYARGRTVEQIEQQHAEIDRLNAWFGESAAVIRKQRMPDHERRPVDLRIPLHVEEASKR